MMDVMERRDTGASDRPLHMHVWKIVRSSGQHHLMRAQEREARCKGFDQGQLPIVSELGNKINAALSFG